MEAFVARRLFDGKVQEYRLDVAVLVENGIILSVVPKKEVPARCNVVDLGDLTITPGLIDCHVHLVWNGCHDPNFVMVHETPEKTAVRAAEHARVTLLHGITTVRDCGGPHLVVLAVRDAVREHIILGSRVLAAGSPIVMTGGHVHNLGLEVDGADGARKGVRLMLKAGVDLIKVMATGGVYTEGEEPGSPQLTVAELSAAVEEAHKAGRKVAAHAEGLEGILNALEARVDTIEHGNLMTEEVARRMAEQGTFIVPTMAPFYLMSYFGEENQVPDYAIRKAKEVIQGSYNVIRWAKDFGVPIAAGTDDGSPLLPHGALVYELELMVHAGLTPFEALRSATSDAARCCGLEAITGALEAGKMADFIGVTGNPLEDITSFREVDTVVIGGVIAKRHGAGIVSENDISALTILLNEKRWS
ncbi:MAG: metal-dependent hydrolase family protein [Bacilli bacterium]